MLLSELMGYRSEVTVEIRELNKSVKIGFNPNKITPEYESKNRTTPDNPFTTEKFARMLVDVVCDWDLMQSKSVPLPITYDNLRKLPTTFLANTVTAIMESLNPPDESSTDLNDSSLPPTGQEQPDEESVPIGTR